MSIRRLQTQDKERVTAYLTPYKSECMFLCSNLNAVGIEYRGSDFEGEYFGYFDHIYDEQEQLRGVIVHYWNGNVMMHASNHSILKQLTLYLRHHTQRPIAGVLGSNSEAEVVIENLGLSNLRFSINRNEGLYQLDLEILKKPDLPSHFAIVRAQDISRDLLTQWIKGYAIEALGVSKEDHFEQRIETDVNRILRKDSWVLLVEGVPSSLVAFNARLEDRVRVGPVWTPPEHRNQGFARLLLAYAVYQEKDRGTKQAVLFTGNPAAIRVYRAIGFKKVGDYRVALLETPFYPQAVEFTPSPTTADIEFLTEQINQETLPFGRATPFAFFIRNSEGVIIGGCNGSIIFGSIYTDQLWVDPRYRRQGVGQRLMKAVHDYGRKQGCVMATVTTMSFQKARQFYERLGYAVDFERPGYTNDSSSLFLKRSL